MKRPAPSAIQPMLATATDKPFDDPAWLFEIKWDGYRVVAFIANGRVRLVSRNQNDLSGRFPELQALPRFIQAKSAILDGEVVALDEKGRPSFSLMQQRTGIKSGGRRTLARADVPVIYYVFDLIHLDGYDLRRVSLEDRKAKLAQIMTATDILRYSEHYPAQGVALFKAAKEKGLEGILAKRAESCYEERRTREWLKIKVTQTVDCVIGGYTDPEGSRLHFGSMVLGLYNKAGELIPVGQVGTGFDQATLKRTFQVLKDMETARSPFHGKVDARRVHWVRPERVAEVKFSEWTHETSDGGMKLRAPVFLGLREDKKPEECTFSDQS